MKLLDELREKMPTRMIHALKPDELVGLETQLQATLVPVTPRPEFVARLNKQLMNATPYVKPQALVKVEPKSRESLIIGAATLLGAAALFATGFRVAVTTLGVIGVLVQWANRKIESKPAHTQPAS